VRITRIDLYYWILLHPEHKWYSAIQAALFRCETDLSKYVIQLKSDTLSDGGDVHFECISDLVGRNIYEDGPDKFGNYPDDPIQVFELTHDVSDDVVIGMCLASICYRGSWLEKSVPADSVLPWLPKEDIDNAKETFQKDIFMKGRDYNFYMVQNDCECCS
jgi:hypothetical protein